MPLNFTAADKNIADNTHIEIGGQTESVGLYPQALLPKSGENYRIPIQFPVKVTGESKSANWQLDDMGSYEPLATYKGSNAKSISVEFTYIVVDKQSEANTSSKDQTTGEAWTARRILNIERTFKSYFYRMIDKSIIVVPAVYIYDLYGVVADGDTFYEPTSWRAKSVDIQRSGALLSEDRINLVSRITLELETFTQLANRFSPGEDGKEKPKQIQDNIAEVVDSYWY